MPISDLIGYTGYEQLYEAADVKALADNAEKLQQLKSVANAINQAANCGEYKVVWEHKMLDSVKAELEGKGYTVNDYINTANPVVASLISWRD